MSEQTATPTNGAVKEMPLRGMKACPACDAWLGRSSKKCAGCGHKFAKGHANGPKANGADSAPATPTGRIWKTKKPTKKKAASTKRKATPPPKVETSFRVGMFNDGTLAILARRGNLELDENEALALAEYLRGQFSEATE